MDLYENEHVKSALDNLESMLFQFEIPFTQIEWLDLYRYQGIKGLDDWLKLSFQA